MNTTIAVNGTSYTAAQRAALSISLNVLDLHLDDYDSFAFREFFGQPTPSYKHGWPVTVSIDGTLRFSGFITDIDTQSSETGWVHGYSCSGVRWWCDRFVPVTGEDGTGTFELDTPPDDIWTLSTDRGLTVGQILTRLLTINATATALSAAGINYASLSPPTLPSQTVTDFAALNVVPAQSALFQSCGIFSQISQFVSRWMPRFAIQIQPDGTIRAKDTTDTTTAFPPQTFTLPSIHGPGDPLVPFPTVKASIGQVATNVKIRGGANVEGSILSLSDGTLAEGFTSTDKSNWNYTYFTNPKGAEDNGTILSCTSTSAVVQSASPSTTWATNFWASNDGVASLINSTATTPLASISPYIQRQITSCDAMSAGGTATIRWDSAWPSAESDFTTYRIVGSIGGLSNCWRLYLPRDPGTGDTGLNTRIGQNLVYQSPVPIYWSNKTATIGEYFSQGVVVGPSGNSWPLGVTPVPSLGGWMFIQPTVSVYGNPQELNAGSPTTVAQGLPADVQIFALYSIGALTAVYPPNGTGGTTTYSGTASSTWKTTQTIDIPSWTWASNQGDMNTLAEEHWKTMSDIVYDVNLNWVVNAAGTVPSWDYLDFSWSLNIAINGTTSPWSAIDCPVRAIRISWQGTPVPQSITFSATNQRKPFTGDELYTHPQFAGVPALASIGQGGGEFGMATNGLLGMGQYMPARHERQEGFEAGEMGESFGESFGEGEDEGELPFSGRRRRRRPTPKVRSTSLRSADAATPLSIEEQQENLATGAATPRTLAEQQAANSEAAGRVVAAADRQWEAAQARRPVVSRSIGEQQQDNVTGAATPLSVEQQQARNADHGVRLKSLDELNRGYNEYADLGKAPEEDG